MDSPSASAPVSYPALMEQRYRSRMRCSRRPLWTGSRHRAVAAPRCLVTSSNTAATAMTTGHSLNHTT